MQVDWIGEYLMTKPGVTCDLKMEWNWTRYMVGGKLFCAICRDDAGETVYVTVKLEPLRGEFLRAQFEDVIPGYYMNKTHWNSIKAQGDVPRGVVEEMLDESYRLVSGGLTKSARAKLGLL